MVRLPSYGGRYPRQLSGGFADAEPKGSAAQNRITVKVTEAVFAGERCRYMVQTPCRTMLVLKEPSGAAIRRRSVGETVELAWSVADTIVV